MMSIFSRRVLSFGVVVLGLCVMAPMASAQQFQVIEQAAPVSGVPVASPQAVQEQPAAQTSRPVLMITNSPVPKSILDKTYNFPNQVQEIRPSQVVGSGYYRPTETMVSRKLRDLKSELAILQDKVVLLSQALARMQRQNEQQAAAYFASVATINTQLQVGTTPGNPRLLERFATAEQALETLAGRLGDFNNLSIDASKVATEASFLLDSARATYGLSGAIEEDHIQLAEIEDKINTMIVLVERVLNTVTDDISRTSSYLLVERDNLRTLSLAVANGSLYGMSLADRPFSGVRDIRQLAAAAPRLQPQVPASFAPQAAPQQFAQPVPQQLQPAPQAVQPQPVAAPQQLAPQEVAPVPQPQAVPEAAQQRPLVKIRFDRSDVDFEQPLYMAVNQVLGRYPDVSFNVLGLHSTAGGAAETAIESTRSRRNAQKVVRTLSQIGVREDKIGLSYDKSPDIDANEVHLYIY